MTVGQFILSVLRPRPSKLDSVTRGGGGVRGGYVGDRGERAEGGKENRPFSHR